MTAIPHPTVETSSASWQHADVKGDNGARPPITTSNFTLLHSGAAKRQEVVFLIGYTAIGLCLVAGCLYYVVDHLVLFGVKMDDVFPLLLAGLFISFCIFFLYVALWYPVRTFLYDKMFYPPFLVLNQTTLSPSSAVHLSYCHARRGDRGRDRAGFVLIQLVCATHDEPRTFEAVPGFTVLWSSPIQTAPIEQGRAAVSLECDLFLPNDLPASGATVPSGTGVSSEVVWYVRTLELLWPRAERRYEFVLPVRRRIGPTPQPAGH